MRKFHYVFSALALTALIEAPLFCSAATPQQPGEKLYSGYTATNHVPSASAMEPEMTLQQAYETQKNSVTLRLQNDSVAGFKAGITSSAIMEKMNLQEPVAGVLYSSGEYDGSQAVEVPASRFVKPMLECEVAFSIGRDITAPVKDTTELMTYIGGVRPAIEIPDMNLISAGRPTAVDIVAANVGASAFIVGKLMPASLPVNDLAVTLTHNGEIVNRGRGQDALGDQLTALLWLVNQTVEHGWVIKKGQHLLTGALGNMVPGRPGTYEADYGALGKIQFSLK